MEPLGPEDPREISEYRLLARLGEGGMGAVYLSRTRGGQPVAVKLIRRSLGRDPEFRRRFEQEVWAARKVRGYHLIAVLDHDTSGETPWLASEFVAGTSLFETLRTHGPLPLTDVFHLVGCTARALQAIHLAGVVHRDLKPGNIMLSLDGPKVIDFGIAKSADATQLSSGVIGTPQYMSPEHARGERVGPESDVFSLGLIAAVAATGRHPYGEGGGMTVSARIANTDMRPPDLGGYPEELLPLLRRCLVADPSARAGVEELMALCLHRSGRDPGDHAGWLPAPVAREIEERRAEAENPPPPDPGTGHRTARPSAGPAGSPGEAAPPTGPAAGPTRQYTEPDRASAGSGAPPPHGASGRAGGGDPRRTPLSPDPRFGPPAAPVAPRTGRVLVPLAALGAAVVLLFGLLLVRPLFDARDGATGGGPGTEAATGGDPADGTASPAGDGPDPEPEQEAGYEVLVEGRELSVRPNQRDPSGVDLDVPEVDAADVDFDTDEVSVRGGSSGDRWQLITTFGIADGRTPQACLRAAQGNALPDGVEGHEFGSFVPEGTILCTVTSEGNLAMYEVTGLTANTDRYHELPSVEGVLTLWSMP
ncbi:Serine_threonine-protein kinase PknD [Nocardiopsis dassonvillei]|uniref:serine/threonine protein kinase n=1 Tax=Nocardiopsis dassonvillei TaxID=2014 RepID=UPI003F551C2A